MLITAFASAESESDIDLLSEAWDTVSESAKDFLRQLFSYKPHMRPLASQLVQHSWLHCHRQAGMSTTRLKN